MPHGGTLTIAAYNFNVDHASTEDPADLTAGPYVVVKIADTGEGIAPDNVTSKGFGKDNPVASNDTAAGRQKNRRVEMVVSGDIIGGTPIGPSAKQSQ